MSFWNILGKFAFSDSGDTIQKLSSNTSIANDGTVYNTMGSTTVGSDGSVFTQTGSYSSDGSVRMGNTADGIGAVFNHREQHIGFSHAGQRRDGFGFDNTDF